MRVEEMSLKTRWENQAVRDLKGANSHRHRERLDGATKCYEI